MPELKPEVTVRAPARRLLWPWHLLLLALVLGAWYVLTRLEIMPPFFFGEPLVVAQRVLDAFATGTVLGLVVGLWLALAPFASRLLDPYITAVNSMPRVILAPIFAVWFG